MPYSSSATWPATNISLLPLATTTCEYVVDFRADCLPAIGDGRSGVFGDHKPADTLVGVAILAHPGCLIEVEAIAVTEG